MPSQYNKEKIQELLTPLDICINGDRPWDIKVHDPRLYHRVLSHCSLGLGESYMDGWWDCQELDQFFYKLTIKKPHIKKFNQLSILPFIKDVIFNNQNRRLSKRVAEQHYDFGNNFYENMLDKEYMQYTCAYWKDSNNLQEAQINKLDLICKKLHLPMKNEIGLEGRIIELGSGFGGFSKFATSNYNCCITSYNISKEQITYARNMNKGLPVKIIESDYRDTLYKEVKESYNKVVSIGLCEHIGPNNYRKFMKIVNHCLKSNGLFLLHTIGRHNSAKSGQSDKWIDKYIFPGGHLPSASQITKSAESIFRLEDVHNFSHDYYHTLMSWFNNFQRNWEFIKEKYSEKIYTSMKNRFHKWPNFNDDDGERFYRMWKYYLLSSSGAFRSGSIDLFQFIFSKNLSNKYFPVR